MSERKRGLPASTARLLCSLASAQNAGDAIDRIPADWSGAEGTCPAICVAVGFSGTVAVDALPAAIRASAHSRRLDLAGVAWVLHRLAPQGSAAVLVPESFLSESTQGHLALRRSMTESGRLHGIVRLAPGVYKPKSAAAVLLLGPADPGPVWLCDVVDPAEIELGENAQPGAVSRWLNRHRDDAHAARSAASFFVPRDEIAATRFDGAIDRYRSVDAAATATLRPPHEILAELAGLEAEIFQGLRDLVGLLQR